MPRAKHQFKVMSVEEFIQDRKSMAKGGAEKIASIFGWTASFDKDQDATKAFKDIPGIIYFVCNLSKAGIPVGQGRGAPQSWLRTGKTRIKL